MVSDPCHSGERSDVVFTVVPSFEHLALTVAACPFRHHPHGAVAGGLTGGACAVRWFTEMPDQQSQQQRGER